MPRVGLPYARGSDRLFHAAMPDPCLCFLLCSGHRGGVFEIAASAATGDGLIVGFGVDVPLEPDRLPACCAA